MAEPYTGSSDDPGVGGLTGINSTSGVGVWGQADAGRGVVGVSRGGAGVWGHTVTGRAVVGAVDAEGAAVWGETKAGRGVVGVVQSPGGTGVWGAAKSGRGVVGAVDGGNSADDAGVWGESKSGRGVVGVVNDRGGSGVWGATTAGRAVVGVDADSGTGVWGESKTGRAVVGVANADGPGTGVYGEKRGEQGFAGFFEGKVHVTGRLESRGDAQIGGRLHVQDVILLPNADCAEDFDVVDHRAVEPGMLMVIEDDGRLRPCDSPYDRRVAGVVSGAGSYRPGIRLDQQAGRADRVPIALIGKVWCRVDATEYAIGVGDLLTTSALAGHAMKAADPARSFGAVLGKALRPMASGTGLIPVLVALQ